METRTLTDRLQFGAALAKSAMGTYAQPVAAVVAFLAATEAIEGGPTVDDMLDAATRDAVRAVKAQWPGSPPDASAVAVLVVDRFRQRHLDEMALQRGGSFAREPADARDEQDEYEKGRAVGKAWATGGTGDIPEDDSTAYSRGFNVGVAEVEPLARSAPAHASGLSRDELDAATNAAREAQAAAVAKGEPICGATDDMTLFGGDKGIGRVCILPYHPTTDSHVDGTLGPWTGPHHVHPSPPADPPPPVPPILWPEDVPSPDIVAEAVGEAKREGLRQLAGKQGRDVPPSLAPKKAADPKAPAIPNGEDPPDYQEGYAAAVAWANDRTSHDPRADTDERSLSFRQGVVDGERASESKRAGPLLPEAVDPAREVREVREPPAAPAPTPAPAPKVATTSDSGVLPSPAGNRPAIKMPTPAPTKVVATLPPTPKPLPRASIPKPKPR